MSQALSTNPVSHVTQAKRGPLGMLGRLEARHVLGILSLGMLAAGLLLDPSRDPRHVALFGVGIPSTCGFRVLTGYPCPSCGLTRSVCFTVRGELGSAFRLHPMGPIIALGGAVQGAFLFLTLAVPRLARRVPVMPVTWVYAALFAAIFVCGVLRYLGVFPLPPA